ncbi:MAG: extracellular solute-binding protein [Clostridiales bacterium]|nr:extracellular solute-binding protein [Clostridiales bacterium]
MKKSLLKILCLLVTASMVFTLVACGTTQGGGTQASTTVQQEPVTLTFWHTWPSVDTEPTKKAFDKALDDWTVANPNIKIEVDTAASDPYKQKIQTSVAAGEAPDLFFWWGGAMAKPFVDAGKLLALDDYLNDGTKDKILGDALSTFTYGGKIYGLPFSSSAAFIFCNKDVFDKNGVTIPTTFEDLLAAVKVFRAKNVTPFAMGNKERWPIILFQNTMAVHEAGPQLVLDAINKKASFENPAFVKAAANLKALVDAKAFPSDVLGLGYVDGQAAFAKGDIAMNYIGTWELGNLDKDGTVLKGKIVPIKFPAAVGGKGTENDIWGGASGGFVVGATTKNKDIAVKACKFFNENTDKYSYIYGLGLPVWKNSADFDAQVSSQLLKDCAKLLKDATSFTPGWDILMDPKTAQKHLDLCTELLAGTITPEEFAKQSQEANK